MMTVPWRLAGGRLCGDCQFRRPRRAPTRSEPSRPPIGQRLLGAQPGALVAVALVLCFAVTCATNVCDADDQLCPLKTILKDTFGGGHKNADDTPSADGHTSGIQQTSTFDHSSDVKAFEEFIRHLQDAACRDIPSVAFSVVRNGQTLVSSASGSARLDPPTKATKDTLYGVASLTKAFTATLLGKLLYEKGYSLLFETPVSKILGKKYPLMDEYMTDHVTVRDLLLHRTGISRHDILWISGLNETDIFRRLRCMKARAPFRTKAIYNNILYALAGEVAEQLGGATWEQLVQRELLEPLGMTSTTFITDLEDKPTAGQYTWVNGRNHLTDKLISSGAAAIGPAIALYTTAADMTLWMNFHLSKGRNRDGSQVVPRYIMDDMHRGQVSTADMLSPSTMKNDDGSILSAYDMYGLAWYTGYHRGHRVLMHYGSFIGFYSMITLLPSLNFSVFTTMNGGIVTNPLTINYAMHTFALEKALGHKPDGNLLNRTCQTKNERERAVYNGDCSTKTGNYSIPGRHLVKYTGSYWSPSHGNVTVSLAPEDGERALQVSYYRLTLLAKPFNETVFCTDPLAEMAFVFGQFNITFSTNEEGEVHQVTIHFEDPSPHFQKVAPEVSYDEWLEGKCSSVAPSCNSDEVGVSLTSTAATHLCHWIWAVIPVLLYIV